MKESRKKFMPSGKEAFIAAILIGFIAACGVYTYNQMNVMIEEEIPANFVSSTTVCQVNLDDALVPADKILNGGPPKDGIPSLTNPALIAAGEADYLDADERVVGIHFNGEARAYPLRILAKHECVNGSIGDTHFAVIYCPLCDSTSVFNREVAGETLEFGISGKLYQSNVLLYDRQPDPTKESLWSQMFGKAVAGPKKGTQLKTLPHTLVTWQTWQENHPQTKVLSPKVGYGRYSREFYPQYFASPNLMFPMYDEEGKEVFKNQADDLFLLKDKVIGVRANGKAKVYPVEHMQFSNGGMEDTFEGKTIRISKTEEGDILIEADESLDLYHSFWFAWNAFHPETEIYSGAGFDLAEWKKKK